MQTAEDRGSVLWWHQATGPEWLPEADFLGLQSSGHRGPRGANWHSPGIRPGHPQGPRSAALTLRLSSAWHWGAVRWRLRFLDLPGPLCIPVRDRHAPRAGDSVAGAWPAMLSQCLRRGPKAVDPSLGRVGFLGCGAGWTQLSCGGRGPPRSQERIGLAVGPTGLGVKLCSWASSSAGRTD